MPKPQPLVIAHIVDVLMGVGAAMYVHPVSGWTVIAYTGMRLVHMDTADNEHVFDNPDSAKAFWVKLVRKYRQKVSAFKRASRTPAPKSKARSVQAQIAHARMVLATLSSKRLDDTVIWIMDIEFAARGSKKVRVLIRDDDELLGKAWAKNVEAYLYGIT